MMMKKRKMQTKMMKILAKKKQKEKIQMAMMLMIARIMLMIVEIVGKIMKAKVNKEKTQIFDTNFLFRIKA